MSLWRHITRGIRVLGHRRVADQEVADEVSHYLEEMTAALVTQGLSPDEARRAARLEVGNQTALCEQVREYGWENAIDTLFADLRYAIRRLRGTPGFTTASLITLALGIGATTAIFSVVYGILIQPLPYPHSERIVVLRHTSPALNMPDMNIAASLFFTYKDENRVFDYLALWAPDTSNITGGARAEQVSDLLVTSDFLSVLGVEPMLGRGFAASDDDPSSKRVLILSNGYWKSRFNADRAILGRSIMIDGYPIEVVGVLPPSFEFRDRPISFLSPLRIRRSEIRLISFCCEGIARLKPGVTLAQANSDVARMIPMAPAKFAMNPGMAANSFVSARIGPRVLRLKDYVVGDVSEALWIVMGTVSLVLLIACANVANLLLVRTNGRQQELAIRAALGARWGRIARGLLLESLLLGLIGGAMGLAIAFISVRVLVAMPNVNLPRLHEISVNPTVMAFTLAMSLIAGLLFGAIPILKFAGPRLSGMLASGNRSFTQSKERHRASNLLVVVQMALALLLLIGSGLMIRTFSALRHVDPGFVRADELEAVHISIPEAEVKDDAAVARTEEDVLRKIEALPGVFSAAMTSDLPMEGGENEPTYAQDQATRVGELAPLRRYKYVSPGYFSVIGARLIAGREFTWTELYNRTPVALISENMAREMWGDPRLALGKQIRQRTTDDWREVIGVVADLRDNGLNHRAPAIVYWPLLMKNFEGAPSMVVRLGSLIIRTPRAGSAMLFEEIQKTVASVNPNLPIANVETLQSIYARSLARTSFTLVLLAIAGAMALLLGVVGIYGVVSYSVSQRTHEIGIRLALGAPIGQVTQLFLRHGFVMSGIGVAGGLTAAFALTRIMKSLLYEVSPADPLTYVVATSVLVLAASIATYLPVRKATQVDPACVLRAQ